MRNWFSRHPVSFMAFYLLFYLSAFHWLEVHIAVPDVLAVSYTHLDVYKRQVENCDAVAAVCEDDSVNLMAAQIAKNIFRREKVICRVSDPHLQVLYHKTYELDTICPTILTEQAVFRALAK